MRLFQHFLFILPFTFSPTFLLWQSVALRTGCFPPASSMVARLAIERKKLSCEEPSAEERELHALINAYRASHKLPAIPLSKSLSHVARIHVYDLNAHPPESPCNTHTWSEHGAWSSCCYTPDHKQAKCMWDKPSELTNYQDPGFEIGFWTSAQATSQEAMEGWKNSPAHNAVIINQDIWKDTVWKSVGVGLAGQYAVVWFGKKNDPDGYWPGKSE